MSIKNKYLWLINSNTNKFKYSNSGFNDLLFNKFSETEVQDTNLKLKDGKSPKFNIAMSELLKVYISIMPLVYWINLNFKTGIYSKNT